MVLDKFNRSKYFVIIMFVKGIVDLFLVKL
jgi:hypothetical protein